MQKESARIQGGGRSALIVLSSGIPFGRLDDTLGHSQENQIYIGRCLGTGLDILHLMRKGERRRNFGWNGAIQITLQADKDLRRGFHVAILLYLFNPFWNILESFGSWKIEAIKETINSSELRACDHAVTLLACWINLLYVINKMVRVTLSLNRARPRINRNWIYAPHRAISFHCWL